nr:type I-E CRISPR-associated protein Cas5/CasD [Planomonospora venezuelensis]
MVLRLAGPLQSWGEHSAFADRDTMRHPTRSGLIGMFAGAYGLRRDEPLDRFDGLEIIVRIDRPGILMTDFHTVGGGRTREQTVPTSEGGRRSVETATIVTRRHYLADAVFAVGVAGSSEAIGELAERLANPRWQPYLGRRACPPDQPMLLKQVKDPLHELTEAVPLARRPPKDGRPHRVDFVLEGAREDASAVAELVDVPVNFSHLDRRYCSRAVSIARREIAEHLWLGRGNAYLKALFAYVEGRS